MRVKLALLALAVSATALPAAAQRYQDPCQSARRENQVAGAVIGGLLGGVLGSNVAASGHRHDGTAVGAVVGALAGSEMGRGGTNCNSGYYGRNDAYYGAGPQPYGPAYSGAPYDDSYYAAPAYYPEDRYGRGGYPGAYAGSDANRDNAPRHGRYNDLDGYQTPSYNDSTDFAGRECADATQVTRLPDGTEIHRPVEACREARYGGWTVEN